MTATSSWGWTFRGQGTRLHTLIVPVNLSPRLPGNPPSIFLPIPPPKPLRRVRPTNSPVVRWVPGTPVPKASTSRRNDGEHFAGRCDGGDAGGGSPSRHGGDGAGKQAPSTAHREEYPAICLAI